MSGPEVIIVFICSTQVGMGFIMHINVKMPSTVGILTFISRIESTSESFKTRKKSPFLARFFEHLKFHA